MIPVSFDDLSSLDQNLAKKGREAEEKLHEPEYCYFALRGFIGYALQFLEREHSIPPPQSVELVGVGPDEFRINRLPKWGVEATRRDLSALHDIRFYGNKGSHAPGNEKYFTAQHAENAINAARLVRNWLYEQYVQTTNPREESGRFNTFTAGATFGSQPFDTAIDARLKISRPIAATLPEPHQTNPYSSVSPGTEKRPTNYVLKGIVRALSSLLVLFLAIGGVVLLAIFSVPTSQTVSKQTVSKSAQYDGKKTTTLRDGDLTITLDSQPDPAARKGRAAVAIGRYQGRPAFSLRAEQGGATSEVKIVRLDTASSYPHVVFTSFSGGAHCCTETKIAAADASGIWSVVAGRFLDGELGYELMDLDGDGAYELVSKDNDFLYAFACYACSFAPARIEKLVGRKLVDVTRDPKYQPFLRGVLRRMEANGANNPRSNGYLGGWVASKVLVGELGEAWQRMLVSYDRSANWNMEECVTNTPLHLCPANQKRELMFPQALLKILVNGGYVAQAQARGLRLQ